MNNRRMKGIPRAGDLYVNGVRVPKGNVPAAVRRVYKQSDRRKADVEGELADTIVVAVDARVLEDEVLDGRCPSCNSLPFHGDRVALERSTGRWWHLGVCRTRWVQQHGTAAE